MPEGSVVEHRAVETPFLNCEDDECDVEISGARVPLQRITLLFPAGAPLRLGAHGAGCTQAVHRLYSLYRLSSHRGTVEPCSGAPATEGRGPRTELPQSSFLSSPRTDLSSVSLQTNRWAG